MSLAAQALLAGLAWLGAGSGPGTGPGPGTGAASGAGDEPQESAQSEATVVTPEQVEAVERGLAWLAAHQEPNGSWSAGIGYKLNNDYDQTDVGPHVGVTSLCCLAFLAGGHQPGRGRYGEVLDRGIAFVLSCTQEDGYIAHRKTRMYSHAFSTLFLAEVYGMTRRPDVGARLQRAVDYIVAAQNAEGGWRYAPMAPDSDMSIVVCQVMALRAARNIGIQVPRATVDNASRYVVASSIGELDLESDHRGILQRGELGAFRYQKGTASRSSFPLTAAGVASLHGLGIYSDEKIRLGLDYLKRTQDFFDFQYGQQTRGHYFFWYGHYYAVQAMYQAGGADWEFYFPRIRRELVAMQLPDGSFPNEVGPGPAFGTAMGLLILEIPYRFLPIFQR